MPVIARDAVASDHLVYAWPFPIGPEEYEVACAEDELVVMCPSWMVGDRLGPGRHRWRTPDPMRPVSAYFVLTAPVEVSFDCATQFIIPNTGQPVRLRANGALQVRCTDPTLLIAQFVGLPFDHVNDGILRSVSRSVERMLARLLTRRVVMAGTPAAVTDRNMLPHIIEELVAYNPAAGAVFGIEMMRMGQLAIYADDGAKPWSAIDWSGVVPRQAPNGDTHRAFGSNPPSRPDVPLLETVRQRPPTPPLPTRDQTPTPPMMSAQSFAHGSNPPAAASSLPPGAVVPPGPSTVQAAVPPVPLPLPPPPTPIPGAVHAPAGAVPAPPPPPKSRAGSWPQTEASGEIQTKPAKPAGAVPAPSLRQTSTSSPPPIASSSSSTASGTLDANRKMPTPAPTARKAGAVEVPASTDEITQPGVDIVRTPLPGSLQMPKLPEPPPNPGEARGAIMGIGTSAIGSSASGEIPSKVSPGGRVLVPGPNGLMQSATVRQLLQGYYELEVGGSGETIWVPINGVVPEH